MPNQTEKYYSLLLDAINVFYSKDKDMLEHKAIEQAMVFRIGLYYHNLLQQDTHNLVLDCEYNKHGNNPKEITTDDGIKRIRPDFILHRRGFDSDNILAVEFKGYWSKKKTKQNDKDKLNKLLDSPYNYKLVVFVLLNKENPEICFLETYNGEWQDHSSR